MSPRQNVVVVRRNNQAFNRQPHPARRVAGENVAEVSSRHGKRHWAIRRAKRGTRHEIIGDLGDDTRPVDRVHAC